MDSSRASKKSLPKPPHSPRASSAVSSTRDDEKLKSSEPTTPPPPSSVSRSNSSSRLVNRIKLKESTESASIEASSGNSNRPPMAKLRESGKADHGISRGGSSNKSFNESNGELLRTLLKNNERHEEMLSTLLKEVRCLTKESKGGSSDQARPTSSPVGPESPSTWVRVFSKSNNRYLQINTSTGQILEECEVVGNGWEMFLLPDRDQKIWVEPGSKKAVFNPPVFLQPVSTTQRENSGKTTNVGGELGSLDSNLDDAVERFRVLLTPRTSAAQARALALQASKEAKKNSARIKATQGHWNTVKNSIKHIFTKKNESDQFIDDTSHCDSRDTSVSQGFIELQTRVHSGEASDVFDGPRRPRLSRRISLGMGKMNDIKGAGKGKMKTVVMNDQGELEEVRTVKQASIGMLMLNPDGTARMSWDILVIVPFLVFLAAMTPFFLCFGYDPARKHNPHLLMFEAIVDGAFLLDIVLNFRTGYITMDGEVEYDSRLVALNYLKGWFSIDFVSGIPYSIFLLTDSNSASSDGWLSSVKVLKVTKILRALRVVRFFKLTKMLKTAKLFNLYLDAQTKEWVEDFLSQYGGSIQVKFIQVIFLLALLCHLMGCFWVLVAREGSRDGQDTWLSDGTVVDDFTYKSTKWGPNVGSIYIAAFYYCMTTMTSVGYGDLHPLTDRERTFTIFLEGIGCVMYALVVATLTSVIMSKDANARAMSEKLENIRSYVIHRGFSPVLARKLRAYFRHFYSQKMAIDEMQILKDCSTGLRMEVSSFLVSNLMDKVSLFRLLPPTYWARMLPVLRPCLFTSGEVICTQGDETSDMFIILDGACRAFTTGVKERLNESIHLESQHADCNIQPTQKKRNKSVNETGDGEDEHGMRVNMKRGSSRNKDRILQYDENMNHQVDLNASIDNGVGLGSQDHMEAFEIARFVVAGGVLNALAALGVWPRCVESVVALEVSEAYVVSGDDLASLFKDDRRLWDNMCKRAVMTGFAMVSDPEAPTEYGMPVHVLPKEEIAEREAQFEIKMVEESRKRWVAMERRQSGALALSSRAMMSAQQSEGHNDLLHTISRSNSGAVGPSSGPGETTAASDNQDLRQEGRDDVQGFPVRKVRSKSVNGGEDWKEST